MGSLRTPGIGETIASHTQSGEAVQEVGAMLWTGTEWKRVSGNIADGEPVVESVPVVPTLLNQAGTVDRQRNNIDNEVGLPLKNWTGVKATPYIKNYNHTKLIVNLFIAKAGSGTIQISVVGELHTIAVFRATNNDGVYNLAPGLPFATKGSAEGGGAPESTTETAGCIIPAQFLIRVTPSNETAWEYEVRYSLLI
jgi:hypothetical protein